MKIQFLTSKGFEEADAREAVARAAGALAAGE